MGRKLLVLLSTLVFALAGFLWAWISGPVWEARATLSLTSPEASAALPGMLAETGASAWAIPGTDVLETALRGFSPEAAQARLDDTLGKIPEFLFHLEISGEVSILVTSVRCLSRPRLGLSALVGGILGVLAAILWTMPAPEPGEPMDLGLFLKDLGRAFRRRLLPISLTVSLCAGVMGLWQSHRNTPDFTAAALIRVGPYDPATADGLSAAFLGLLDSQLGSPDAEAVRVGKTNLFRLSFVSDSKAVAISKLDAALDRLPRLTVHMAGNPGAEILQPPTASGPESPSLWKYPLMGGLTPSALWLCVLAGEACRKSRTCIP